MIATLRSPVLECAVAEWFPRHPAAKERDRAQRRGFALALALALAETTIADRYCHSWIVIAGERAGLLTIALMPSVFLFFSVFECSQTRLSEVSGPLMGTGFKISLD